MALKLDEQEKADVLQALALLNGIVDRNLKGTSAVYVKMALAIVANVLVSGVK